MGAEELPGLSKLFQVIAVASTLNREIKDNKLKLTGSLLLLLVHHPNLSRR
jgi:hypothetical protein